jgi:hypothetical protein
LTARPLGYFEMRTDWTAILDGMLYFRAMTPPTSAGVTAAAGAP